MLSSKLQVDNLCIKEELTEQMEYGDKMSTDSTPTKPGLDQFKTEPFCQEEELEFGNNQSSLMPLVITRIPTEYAILPDLQGNFSPTPLKDEKKFVTKHQDDLSQELNGLVERTGSAIQDKSQSVRVNCENLNLTTSDETLLPGEIEGEENSDDQSVGEDNVSDSDMKSHASAKDKQNIQETKTKPRSTEVDMGGSVELQNPALDNESLIITGKAEEKNGKIHSSADESDKNLCLGDIFCNCSRCKILLKTNQTHTREEVYYCDICGRKFYVKSRLAEHMNKDGTCKGLRIQRASKKSTQDSAVQNEDFPFKCDLCEKSFSSEIRLNGHSVKAHLRKIYNWSYNCDKCETSCKSSSALYRHKSKCHSAEPYECGHCSKLFSSKYNLRKHIYKHHLSTETYVTSKKCFCECCGKFFSSNYHLKVHMSLHTGVKDHTCEDCGKSFRTYFNLNQHQRVHSDKRPFSCDLCSKAFKIKHHLQQHMAVHGMVHPCVRRQQKHD